MTVTSVVVMLSTLIGGPRDDGWQRFFAAIRAVESVNGTQLIGDGGRSLGPYHIGRAYFQDACAYGNVRWDYTRVVWSEPHCRQIMRWYWQRWVPKAYAARDWRVLAAVHQGGYRGHLNWTPRRREYWRRVKGAMK